MVNFVVTHCSISLYCFKTYYLYVVSIYLMPSVLKGAHKKIFSFPFSDIPSQHMQSLP